MKFNHAFDVAFEVISNRENGDDVTPAMLKAALLKRIESLDEDGSWLEACSIYDTHEEGK